MAGKSSAVKQAAYLHKKGKYLRSNQVLKRSYSLKNVKATPATVYYIYAQNLFKTGKYGQSINFFNLMIKKRYLKSHIKTIRAFKKEELDGDEVPRILKQTYFYMGLSYKALYEKSDKTVYLSKARRYLRICDEVDYSDRCSDDLDFLAEQEQLKKLSKNYYEFFVYAGRMLHQDKIYIKNDSTDEEIEVLSNNSSICYGAGLRLTNAFRGFEASGCVYSGNATVYGQGSKNYKQSGVPIAGFMSELGYFWKPDDNKTRLGLSATMLYKSGNYSEPTGWTIRESKSNYIGYTLTAGHELSFFELQGKLSRFGDQSSYMLVAAFNF